MLQVDSHARGPNPHAGGRVDLTFFQSERLDSKQSVVWAAYSFQMSSDESVWPLAMQGAKNIGKILLLAWKCFDGFIKKQMFISVITGKENASYDKIGIVLHRYFHKV